MVHMTCVLVDIKYVAVWGRGRAVGTMPSNFGRGGGVKLPCTRHFSISGHHGGCLGFSPKCPQF